MTRVARNPLTTPVPASAKVLTAGTRLGRYELIHPVATGGMAEVWVAEQAGDLGFKKIVALKMIRPEMAFDAMFRSMFFDEACLASRIHHPNVVDVLDLGVDGPVVFQAMPFIEGVALSVWALETNGRRRPFAVGLRIAIDVLHGLHAAHELCDDDGTSLGLVHRDVSPQNVLIGVDGLAKLADFGIAKAVGRITDETCRGEVKGKLGYLAPEALDGLPSTRESDLFSAGVVLWEILTGKRLFKIQEGDTKSVRVGMVVRDPRHETADIPAPLAAIVMRALQPDPRLRFRTALEMATAIEAFVDGQKLDATHRRVAASLDADLGPSIREKRDAIRAARRARAQGGRGTGPVAEPRSDSAAAPAKASDAAQTFDPRLARGRSKPRLTASPWAYGAVVAATLLAVVGTAVWSRGHSTAMTTDIRHPEGALAPVDSPPPSPTTSAHALPLPAPPPTSVSEAASTSAPPRAFAQARSRSPSNRSPRGAP